MAKLAFTFTVEGLAEDAFVVRKYNGHESLSDSITCNNEPCYGFRYFIELASRNATHKPEDIVDVRAQLSVIRNGHIVQRVHGIVRNFCQGDTGHSHTYYSLTLVPALERLSLRHNSRIFQFKTVPEIISILLKEMGINDFIFSIKRDCKQREYCVQYRESDIDFLHRIAAEEGINYHFIHSEGKHTLFFTDNSHSLTRLDSPIPYNANTGGTEDTPYISSLIKKTRIQESETHLSDYSFKKPEYRFPQNARGADMAYQKKEYEHFDFPGRFKDDETGKAINQIRLEYLRREAHTAQVLSNDARLHAGLKFTLADHLDNDFNRDWVVTNIHHHGTQPQALEEDGGHSATTYSNQFTVIPAHITWRATPQPRPQVDGPCIAVVVGPENEEIFCDQHGRIKLHFPWDRYSNQNEHSSCWVRVSQGWAGNQYGSIAIPRIGHEVIVSFLNGDPDQPIVTGRTYHATNKPPYLLPDHKTKTVIRSESHKGSGFNELSFEDQSQKEKIYLHAQRDFESKILNDQRTHIKHDSHLTIDNDQFTQIKNSHHLTIEGESRTRVTNDSSLITDGNAYHKVNNRYALDAGNEVHLKSGAQLVIEAGAEITLKAGGSFVKIDPSGVSVVGPMINLNSGGSAGSGSGFNGLVALLPNSVEQAPTPPPCPKAIPFHALLKAELAHIPTVKSCPLKQGES